MVQRKVQIPEIGEIILKKNPRSKRIKLYVKPNCEVIASLPSMATFGSAEKFAKQHTGWIKQQLAKIKANLPGYTINSEIQTKQHTIKITEGNVVSIKVDPRGDTVTIIIPKGSDITLLQEQIRHVITQVYRLEAHMYLPQRIAELANKYGFSYNKLSIRNNKTNWGSCSQANNISLNLNLMKLPSHLIDYIIKHELVHTIVKNHSADFYKELNKVTNNKALALAKEVKQYSLLTY